MMQSIEIPFAAITSNINFEKTGIETNFEEYKNDPDNFWMSEANRMLNEQNQGKGKVNLTSNPVFAPIELDFE